MRFSTVVFLAPVAAILLTGVHAKPTPIDDGFGDSFVSVPLDNQEPLLPTTAARGNPYGSLRGTNLKYSGVCGGSLIHIIQGQYDIQTNSRPN